jgi:hypothetical protein
LPVRPETVSIVNKKEPISAGREYQLECRSTGSRPPATITWWKNVKFQQQSTSKVKQTALLSSTIPTGHVSYKVKEETNASHHAYYLLGCVL